MNIATGNQPLAYSIAEACRVSRLGCTFLFAGVCGEIATRLAP